MEEQDTQIPARMLELYPKLSDPTWRIYSGMLYKIMIKGEADDETLVVPFIPNEAQDRFIKDLHYRNLILKSRQKGFTTLVAILWLDEALWVANRRCGIIAQDREAAEVIFRDKVKFGYDNLPDEIKEWATLTKDSAVELLFEHNNSSVRVATSMRSGTIHRLHISEFGKICAKFPDKALEVVTGSFPAVPLTGITVVESTAEGEGGEFHAMSLRAMKMLKEGKKLTDRDWKFHFFAWWDASPEYEIDPDGVNITEKDNLYFDSIEAKMNTTLSLRQRAWYVATRDADYPEYPERMWQEYCSTPEESFKVSTEGCYYTKQITDVRKQGRILQIPRLELPVFTWWDIGNSDGCAVWFEQLVGMEHRFINYYEDHGQTLGHYVSELQRMGYVFAKHYLPHDAGHKRLSDTNKSTKDMLEDLGLQNIEIVPVISNITTGINQTRKHFPSAYFDQEKCAVGLSRLENYKKKWSKAAGKFLEDEPYKLDGNSEGADAFRQWAQTVESGGLSLPGNRPRSPRRPPDWRS